MKNARDVKKFKDLKGAILSPQLCKEKPDNIVQPTPSKQKCEATVFDAVAGRVSHNGFIPDRPFIFKYRDTLSSTAVAVPPEEVLFRQKNAPTRYEEDDIYFASSSLPLHQKLPDSDLLKAIHTYTSDFYGRATNHSQINYKSMDETALIALGILLEEAAAECLGETGDMAFAEGDEDEQSVASVATPLMGQTTKGLGSSITRSRKRRKLYHGRHGDCDEAADEGLELELKQPTKRLAIPNAARSGILKQDLESDENSESVESEEDLETD